MKLTKLIKVIDIEFIENKNKIEDIEIEDISYDSRKLKSNSIFIAIEGFKTDGHKYINEAIKKGAKAIIIEKDIENYNDEIVYIKVENSRKAMAFLAAEFYNNPQKKLKLIGITGTNGKTTTSYLIKSILKNAGYKTALIGTIGNFIGGEKFPSTRTTPNSLELHKLFHKMLNNNVEYVVMEVSSHAIDLKRILNLKFNAAVFTNISQDHLDYHKNFEEYINVKSKLFEQVKKNGYSIINVDDKNSDKIISNSSSKIMSYSIKKASDLKAKNICLDVKSSSFQLENYSKKINLNISGKFNVYNALAAIGVGFSLNISYNNIKEALERVKGIPGRFELVKENQNFTVIIDYAHTADGMKNVLKTITDLPRNDIITIFGCGGDRDRDKRPKMAKVAAKYSDYFIITTDNPRSEDPEAIISDIIKGLSSNKDNYEIIVDRKEAIFKAIKQAQKNDIIIIFGKGHENYQVFRDKTIHFDDKEEAKKAIKALKKERI
ncbi:MAG: UDP-N-acetylmuramoyl-L-alanyl-D-glutamate--2,6-diaminopimelate ligase [Bacillota bacterium]